MRPGELNKEILRLSLPAIASNITVPLLSLSDTAISGHIGDFRTLGAISAGSMMFNTAFWLFGFLRMGTAGMTAQAFGKKDERLAQTVFSQALAIAILSGLLLWAFSSPLSRLLCAVISPSADVAAAAIGYFRITIMCAPALLGIMAFNGWFFGMQSALYPMIIAIFTNLLNIALSITLVFWTDAGFEGVAIGTAAANWCGLVLAFILAVRFMKRKRLLAKLRDMADLSLLRRFFKVNSDIFLRSGCIMCVSLAITSFGARQGDLQLATNAVMMQFFILFSYFMDGIAFSAASDLGILRHAAFHRIVPLRRLRNCRADNIRCRCPGKCQAILGVGCADPPRHSPRIHFRRHLHRTHGNEEHACGDCRLDHFIFHCLAMASILS